jgi:hypothetical protein
MPLPHPGPLEPEPPVSGNGQPARHDRFHPTPFSPAGRAFLHESLARQARRRLAYPGGPLRVCVDGAERWQVDPRVGVCGPFRVPLSASFLDICGGDSEGALLLAVFPLPEPDRVAGEGAEHLSVTLEGGQTVALDIALAEGTGGEAQAYVIQLAYTEPAAMETVGAEPSPVRALLPTPSPGAIHDGGAGETHRPPVP